MKERTCYVAARIFPALSALDWLIERTDVQTKFSLSYHRHWEFYHLRFLKISQVIVDVIKQVSKQQRTNKVSE